MPAGERNLYDAMRDAAAQRAEFERLDSQRSSALVAHLIIECAQRRKESRGLHSTLDYPDKDEAQRRDTVLRQADGPPL